MIEIKNVSKQYGATTVVDDVTTVIPAGGLTSIIGPNGAGKSTLLSMVSRLIPMEEGNVTVDGLNVSKTPSKTLAKKLAILRQDNHVSLRLRVRDLVGFGRFPHNGGQATREDRAIIAQAMQEMDITPLAFKYLDELSGGQRQRAFIAMVLAQDTDYILLDEPLNNLDMRHSVEMMKLMRRLVDEQGKTVVVVLHDINFASVYSDTIMAMRDGRLVQQSTPEELMTTEKLAEVYQMQIPIHEIDGKRIGVYFG
ncbi:ATP-binding cassette domain-containing protein [Pseudoglutamicibacter cumminsii]|uniref:iron ABC transporter ATP-binding protein n=1 Tax=Pseudoglutamicibacter cumminsii TaxID=156979 RepID=UPI002555A6B1|nr:ATP-binding cassette domain-containing protein [Pseudoglutamicibacter cumminsii]MDK7083488.1 ATP-binding cassette domain-containing protein [Pseudoglutamicibacter cumminsii]